MGRLTKRNKQGIAVFNTSEILKNPIDKIIDKLAHYEDLEEQGRLIELPCAVGETVYVIEEDFKDISSIPTKYYYIEENPYDFYMYYAIGDWIFLTKEEAERKLKELEGEKE